MRLAWSSITQHSSGGQGPIARLSAPRINWQLRPQPGWLTPAKPRLQAFSLRPRFASLLVCNSSGHSDSSGGRSNRPRPHQTPQRAVPKPSQAQRPQGFYSAGEATGTGQYLARQPSQGLARGRAGTQDNVRRQPASKAGGHGAKRIDWKASHASIKAQDSCSGVVALIRAAWTQGIPVTILSTALDAVVAISKRPGFQQSASELEAVNQLLVWARREFSQSDAWALAAFIRCAAAFKTLLQPDTLTAWQRALRPVACELTSQGVCNALLALGTLAESDEQLAAAVDERLAEQLLQHAVLKAAAVKATPAAGLSARHAANVLYGAALLGLQPNAAQMAAVFAVVQQAPSGLDKENVTQLLLACQKLAQRADQLWQEGRGKRVPPEPAYQRYYPGDSLMVKLLERACKLGQRQQLGEQAASLMIGACGELGYLPNPKALQQLFQVLARGKIAIPGVSATLVGCAKLGVLPEPELLELCTRLLREDQHQHYGAQGLTNGIWALAVLEKCCLEVWASLTSTLTSNIDLPGQLGLQQWHQAYLLMKVQYGRDVACPPELFQHSLVAHRAKLARKKSTGHFECALAQAVRQLAVGHVVEAEQAQPDPDGEGGVWVDVALPQMKIAGTRWHFFLQCGAAAADWTYPGTQPPAAGLGLACYCCALACFCWAGK